MNKKLRKKANKGGSCFEGRVICSFEQADMQGEIISPQGLSVIYPLWEAATKVQRAEAHLKRRLFRPHEEITEEEEITVSASLELLGEGVASLLEELLKIKDPRPVLLRIGTEEYEGDMWVKAGEVLIRVPREALEIPTHAEFQPPENISMSFFEYAESPNFPLELSELSITDIVDKKKYDPQVKCPYCGGDAVRLHQKVIYGENNEVSTIPRSKDDTQYHCLSCEQEF